MINTYYIKIVADEHYQRVECGGNTPALLEDAIKAAVKEFYKEGDPLPEDTVIFQNGVAEGRRLEREDMWMAEQGLIKEGEVTEDNDFIKFNDGTYIDLCPDLASKAFDLKNGDKVIVQIRKKEGKR